MKSSQINLELLRNALKSLEGGLNPSNTLERDGAIQRFEYTFELSWKTLAKFLTSDQPLEDNSVKGIFREAARRGLIEDVEAWFSFQYARNQTSHVYREETAKEVFAVIKGFIPHVRKLLKKIESAS